MKTVGHLELKSFSAVVPGELLVFGDGRREMGIALAKDEGSDCLVGVFESHGEAHPMMARQSGDLECLSFGTDWLLEPVHGDQSFPGPHQILRRAGLLALTRDGWLMNFATSPIDRAGQFAFEWWNIGSNVLVSALPDRAVFFSEWHIWASAADRHEYRGEPAFSFKANPTARHGS